MTESELRRSLIDGPRGCYLFCGEEYFMVTHWAAEMRKRVLGDDASLDSFNHLYFEGDLDVAQLRDASLTMPFMADCLLIEWQDVPVDDWKEEKKDRFLELFEELNRSDGVVLMMISRPELFDIGTERKPSARFQKLSSVLSVVRFDRQDESRLAKWIVKHFASAGLTVDAKAPYELMKICGTDMNRLNGEIEKLTYYALAKGGSVITEPMIRSVTSPSSEETAFGLVNAVSDGDRRRALDELYYHKIAREEPLAVLGKISRTLCDMLMVSQLRDAGKTPSEVESMLRLNAFVVKNYYNASRKMGTDRLAKAVAACRKCDRDMKSGNASYGLLEQLICSLPRSL